MAKLSVPPINLALLLGAAPVNDELGDCVPPGQPPSPLHIASPSPVDDPGCSVALVLPFTISTTLPALSVVMMTVVLAAPEPIVMVEPIPTVDPDIVNSVAEFAVYVCPTSVSSRSPAVVGGSTRGTVTCAIVWVWLLTTTAEPDNGSETAVPEIVTTPPGAKV